MNQEHILYPGSSLIITPIKREGREEAVLRL